MPVIDADAHVIETERTWDYLAQSEQRFRPHTAAPTDQAGAGRPQEFWIVDGRMLPRRQNVGLKDTTEATREMADIDTRLHHMDQLGVDVQVLYPTLFLRPVTSKPEVELALCRSYNRWMADIWRHGKGRLRWAAMLPFRMMDASLEELRFSRDNGACAVFMRYMEADYLPSEPYFYPLYQEAATLDVPMCIHASSGSFATHEIFSRGGPMGLFKLGCIGAFHSLIVSEVPDRFPTLRFGFIELGAQWVPYALHYIGRSLEIRGERLNDRLLAEKRFYVACQNDDDLPYVLGYAGPDTLVMGTDYGHADTASELEALQRLRDRGTLPAGAVDRILYDNPKALYGL